MAISLEFKAETTPQSEAERCRSNRFTKTGAAGSLRKNVDPSVWFPSSHQRASALFLHSLPSLQHASWTKLLFRQTEIPPGCLLVHACDILLSLSCPEVACARVLRPQQPVLGPLRKRALRHVSSWAMSPLLKASFPSIPTVIHPTKWPNEESNQMVGTF